MPALPYPQYGIENLYLFPVFTTHETFARAIGTNAPEWNPSRSPKYWFDPKAKDSVRSRVAYRQALVTSEKGAPLADPQGKPLLDVLVLPKEEAATVNIPPNRTNTPGADAPFVPVPLRELEANEELFFAFGGVVAVRNTSFEAPAESGFTASDRALLKAIAAKMGL